jgi:hypothetical protein
VGVWERFGSARVLARARAAELRGELEQAATLFAQAGRRDEAARVMVLRGDGETDPALRLRFYVQAASTAPDGSPAMALARRKRANLLIASSADRVMTATLRQDLLEAARELEALGELEVAADAYGRAGDVEGEARSLARAGDVDKLDALLHAQQGRDRESIARRDLHERFAVLAASGRRREAASLARSATDAAIREQGRDLEARRVSGEVVNVSVRGRRLRLALGAEVTIGRVASLSLASAALSRQHVALVRRGDDAVVRDLGSRNGTTLRGMALAGEVRVGEGVELQLGGQIPLVVRPSAELAGAFAIDLAGTRTLAPLGPAQLGVGRWRLERAGSATGATDDSWVELVTGDDPPAFMADLSLAPRISLLTGDAFATERSGDPVVLVEAQ